MKKKILPLGEDDFRLIREKEKGSYYVDKTLMIRDFLDYENAVTLITRPRRFGKTLNMTMIRDFFDITQDSRKIFHGLAIMETEYADKINSTPVVSLSLKDCVGKTLAELEASIAEVVFKEYKKYGKYLANVDKEDAAYLRFFQTLEILESKKENEERQVHLQKNIIYLRNSIAYLIEALHTFYGVRPIVLIDEYDNPIIEAHLGGYRKEFTSFYAAFLTVFLKGNSDLGQAMLTGIQRVAKASIFSKLNNIVVYTVLDHHYSQYFGLTTEETATLLKHYDLELNDEVASYYDGYSFSGVEVYNPWSILSYAEKKKMRSYWVKTSDNVLIKESLLSAEYSFHRLFERLIKNGEAEVQANLEASFSELPETSTLWGLFINAGYLTVIHEDLEFDLLTVRIPNKEVAGEFRNLVSHYTKLSSQKLQEMLKALVYGEIDTFLDVYRELVLESTSYHDAKENAYHMLMLGMIMQLREIYKITSNIESGHGRSDIILESKESSRCHIIIEFKQGDDVEKLKHDALEQIKNKKYYTGLKGNILLIGIAHEKKKCQLVHEMISH